MGGFLSKPNEEKTSLEGGNEGVRYGMVAMQGWRVEMEDAHLVHQDKDGIHYFGVFDGHAGSKVAKESAENLLSFLSLNDSDSDETIKENMRKAFLKLDEYLRSEVREASGSTAIVCVITPSRIILSNCGDSRGLLCRNGELKFATEDHKPYNENEKSRIVGAGGMVMMQRVNGSLGVSRALGDFSYKGNTDLDATKQMVSPEPDTTIHERVDDDRFVVLACDGIYDVVENDEVVQFVEAELRRTSSLAEIGGRLIDICLAKNSRDNMTIILITLPGAPKVLEDEVERSKRKEAELTDNIRKSMEEMLESASDPLDYDLPSITTRLSETYSKENEMYFYLKIKFIEEELERLRMIKFGNAADNSFSNDESDPSKAPIAMDEFKFNKMYLNNEGAGESMQSSTLPDSSEDALISNPDETSAQGSDRSTPPKGASNDP